ncbi:MAG: STAS domain-containing protein [Alphaproteobacteria bacterium]|nr:STAS domain-containing protein [Alphaproteobacteria bacterium]
MKIETDEYVVDCTRPHLAVLSGAMRLASPKAYQDLFEHVHEGLSHAEDTYTIDLQGVQFMNSAGITAMARLVLAARKLDRPLVIRASAAVPWQKKTIASLERLHPRLQVDLS